MTQVVLDIKQLCETGETIDTPGARTLVLDSLLLIAATLVSLDMLGPLLGPAVIASIVLHEVGHALAFSWVGETVLHIRPRVRPCPA